MSSCTVHAALNVLFVLVTAVAAVAVSHYDTHTKLTWTGRRRWDDILKQTKDFWECWGLESVVVFVVFLGWPHSKL